MADISQVTVNEVTYDIKDNTSRNKVLALEELTNSSFLEAMVNLIYPIGSVCITMTDSAPCSIGTWSKIASGKTLVGVDTSSTLAALNSVGNSFGQADAIIPEHTHDMDSPTIESEAAGEHFHRVQYSTFEESGSGTKHRSVVNYNNPQITETTTVVTSTVESHTHNITHSHNILEPEDAETVTNKNYQPSFSVYFWQRIS